MSTTKTIARVRGVEQTDRDPGLAGLQLGLPEGAQVRPGDVVLSKRASPLQSDAGLSSPSDSHTPEPRMALSRASQYALLAATQLKTTGPPVSTTVLAKRGDMPERFLLQVMRSLVNAGICKSTRGVEGGYHLAKSPDKITLLDVIIAIDGPQGAERLDAMQADDPTSKLHRNVSKALSLAAKDVRDRYESVTLASLID